MIHNALFDKIEEKFSVLSGLVGRDATERFIVVYKSSHVDDSKQGTGLWAGLCDIYGKKLRECSEADRKQLMADTEEYILKSGNPKAAKTEEILTFEDVKKMEDAEEEGLITNYVIYKKKQDGETRDFVVKVFLADGEIKEELDLSRDSISDKTAPSKDFYNTEYGTFKDMYNDAKEQICAHIAFPDGTIYPVLITLGSIASYFREIFFSFPYFDYISSEPGRGKTMMMRVQAYISFYGTIASSITEALLFREIDQTHCFYGLDNIERFFVRPKDYSGIIDWLLTSYSRDIPCKRLEKVGDRYKVKHFDGYGMKAFTHIKDFPYELRALKSRCIQIVMQKGIPQKTDPVAVTFTEIRDKLYHARLREQESVKAQYEELRSSNELQGRTKDLYYPLLTIAKLVDEKLFKEVLKYAKEEEIDREEFDEWNKALIQLLREEGLYGSQSPTDIRSLFQGKLIALGLFSEDSGNKIDTRSLTSRLKKLGFKREDKKTDNKSWYIIDEKSVAEHCYNYAILDTPEIPNLVTLPNYDEPKNKEAEGSTGKREEVEGSIEASGCGIVQEDIKLDKLDKLGENGVCHENIEDIEEDGSIRPEAFDNDFQDKQNKDAREMSEEEGLL